MHNDARSLALHSVAVRKILADPQLIERARETLRAWKAKAGMPVPAYFAEWERILDRSPHDIAEVLLTMSEQSTRLRQSSPFATLLTPEERERVYAAFQRSNDIAGGRGESVKLGSLLASIPFEAGPITDAEAARFDELRDSAVASNRVRLQATRAALLAEIGMVTGPRAGALIGVSHGGTTQYPQFQFDAAGVPLPEVSQVLEGLGEKARPWDVLIWFTVPSEHLQGRTPLQVWATDRQLVVDAARRANWFVRD